MLFALLLHVASLPTPAAPRNDVQLAVRRFVAALSADDLSEYEDVAEGRNVSGGRWDDGWDEVRNLVAASRCIDVHSFRVATERDHAGGVTVELEIDATRTTWAVAPATVAMPQSWILEVVCHSAECRIRSARTKERVVAHTLFRAEASERECLLARAGVDERSIAGAVASEAAAIMFLEDRPAERKQRAVEGLAFARLIARRNGDLAAESHALRLLSAILWDDPAGALSAAMESLALARASGDSDAIGQALLATGEAEGAAGDDRGAQDDLQTAASMIETIADPRTSLQALGYRSLRQSNLGDLRAGWRTANEMREQSARFGWVEGQSTAARRLGTVHYILQDFEGWRHWNVIAWQKAVSARNVLLQSYALHNIASADAELGHADRSIEEFRRSLALAEGLPGVEATIEGSLVETLYRARRFREADAAVSKALEHAESTGNAIILGRILTVNAELKLAEGHPAEAIALAKRALAPDAVQAGLSGWAAWQVRAVYGRALKQLGRTNEAVGMFRTAVAEIESQRSLIEGTASHYFEGKTDPYAELAEIYVASGRPREALNISERMRARTLSAILEQGKIDVSAAMTEAEKTRERDLNLKLDHLNRALAARPNEKEARALRAERDAVRVDLERFRQEIEVMHPLLPRQQAGERPVRIPPALRDALLVEYVVRDRRVLILTARRSRDGGTLVKARSIAVSRRRLNALTTRFVHSIEQRDLRYLESARELYDLLVRPVEAELRLSARLCVMPDDLLWRLPFQALVDASHRHLLERMPVFYAPSIRTLSVVPVRRDDASRRRLLALGNPALSPMMSSEAVAFQRDASVGPLPDAEREVEAIRRLYPDREVTVLVGAAATEAAFKREAARYRILHIAAHGLFDERAPMFSALLLAAGETAMDDGFLEAREIADLRLRSDVAILSACETARGGFGAGEGLIGMSWAFLSAGCPTVVVSQWKAASAATARLMIAFHRELLTGATKAEALRRAALQLKKDARTADPFFWANFVVVGQP